MVQTWAGLRALEGWFVHSTLVCATLSEQSSGKETLGEGLEQHQDTKLVTCKRLLPDTLSSAGNKTSSSFRSPLARRCRKLNYRDKSWCGIEGKWLLRLFDSSVPVVHPKPLCCAVVAVPPLYPLAQSPSPCVSNSLTVHYNHFPRALQTQETLTFKGTLFRESIQFQINLKALRFKAAHGSKPPIFQVSTTLGRWWPRSPSCLLIRVHTH